MDVTAMLDRFRLDTNLATNFVSDAQAIKWLNDAADEFQRATEVIESADEDTDIIAGQRNYPVPPGFMRMLRVEFDRNNDGKRVVLTPTSQKGLDSFNINWRQDTGEPTHYYLDLGSTEVVLYAEPSTSITDGLRFEFVSRPNTLSVGADVSNIPPEFHPLLVNYPTYRGLLRDNETTQAMIFKAEWEKGLAKATLERAYMDSHRRFTKRPHFAPGRQRFTNLGSNFPPAPI